MLYTRCYCELVTNVVYNNFQDILVPLGAMYSALGNKNSLRASPYISTVHSCNSNNKHLSITTFLFSQWASWPHISSKLGSNNTSIVLYIMLDDIVDVVAEGKGPKLYDYPLTQHVPLVNVLLVSELKKIVTRQYCMMYSSCVGRRHNFK